MFATPFAFLFVLFFLNLIVTNAQVEEVEVIIMGAGMTGIMAGHELNITGNMGNFVIIEALNQIGGRVKTTKLTPVGMNGGASWISGACYGVGQPNFACRYDGCNPSGVNPMLTRALQDNFAFNRTDIHEWNHPPYPPYIYGPNREDIYSDTEIGNEYDKWWNAQSCIATLYDEIWSGWEADRSYREALDGCGWNTGNLNNIQKSIQWNEYDLEYAYPIDEYSVAMSYGETYCEYGNQDLYVTDPRGYNGIVESYAAEYLDTNDPRLQLSSPIELIEYDQDGVTVTIKDSGKQYHGKYGLVTFSIGVLQGRYQDVVDFNPSLPSWKSNAIQATGYADYIPLYVQFPYAFWEFNHPEISDNGINVLVDDEYGYFGWFLNLNHADLIPGSFIWRFDIVETLAIQLDNQPLEETKQQLTDKLSRYFTVEIPDYQIWLAHWSSNPYVQGAYAAYPVDYDWYGTVNNLQWPVNEILYFGGEATDIDDSGYVHVAYESGRANGQRILDCLGLHNNGGYQCQRGPPPSPQQKNGTALSKKYYNSRKGGRTKKKGKHKY